MEGDHDIRHLVAEVVSRLPEDVQDWLFNETTHAFIGGSGQLGEFFTLDFPPDEMNDGLICLRVVFLSEQLMRLPKDEALYIIAHEIAHSRYQHYSGGPDAERDADSLAASWGFTVRANREEIISRMPQSLSPPAADPAADRRAG